MWKNIARSQTAHILFLVLITFAVYGRIIGHEFINWDDESYVVFNQTIAGFSWEHLRTVFSTYYVGNYAPLHLISYMLDYSLWGLRPGGFLFTNILLHTINGILWYRMLLRWYEDSLLAVAAATLFLIHPVQVETVAWISQRKNLLALLLFLIAWHCYCRYREKSEDGGWCVYAVSVIAFGLALLTKSVVVVFPVVLLCYDFCFGSGRDRFHLKDKIPYVALTAAGIALAMLSQSQNLNGGMVGYHGGSAWYTFLTMLPVLCSYLSMIVWPDNLSALYSPLLHTSVDSTVLYAAAVLTVLAVGGVVLYRRDRRLGFWAMFWLIGLLPVLQIIPLNTLISDRYLYFPMLGVSVLAGGACVSVLKHERAWLVAGTRVIITGVMIVLAFLSFQRAAVWKDSLTLWVDTVEKTPESSRAWGNLGAAYIRLERQQEAFDAFQRGLELNPENEQILYNLGMMYYDAGDFDGAQLCFQRIPKGYRIDGIVPLFGAEGVKP